jgi:methylated-DNA-protein-cysteine methyltransferase related protein
VPDSFPQRVYAILAQVPPGRVITYGTIALLLGEPRKARQVGWALAATPAWDPPLPAHRVINARGELSGGPAFGGYAVQREKLEAEGVAFMRDDRVDLERYLWLPREVSDSIAGSPTGEQPRDRNQQDRAEHGHDQ